MKLKNQKGHRLRHFTVVLSLIGFLFGYSEFGQGLSKEDSVSEHRPIIQKMSALQVPFIANKGQVDNEVRFYAKTFGGTLFVTRKGEMVYAFPIVEKDLKMDEGGLKKPKTRKIMTWVLKERLVGALDIRPEGREKAHPRVSYFKGNRSKWKTDIPTYNRITLGRVYEGIELSLSAYNNKLEKVFIVYTEGNVGDIRLSIEGVNSIMVNSKDELEMDTGHSIIKFSTPVAFQEIEGKRKDVKVAYDVIWYVLWL